MGRMSELAIEQQEMPQPDEALDWWEYMTAEEVDAYAIKAAVANPQIYDKLKEVFGR